jgi:hypothetical protein
VVNYKDQNLSIKLTEGDAAVDSLATLRFANTGTESISLTRKPTRSSRSSSPAAPYRP